jgi:dienelactone hydrolase
MKEQKIEFASGGHTFRGLVVEDEHEAIPRPGVMVLHGGAGLGTHERERSRMLVELGYVAFAPDLFGEVFTSREHGIATITGLVGDPPRLRARLADALACMRARPNVDPARIAAVGFCFGGLPP